MARDFYAVPDCRPDDGVLWLMIIRQNVTRLGLLALLTGLEEGHHVNMLDPTLGVWVVLGPERHELPQVVGAEDGPVTGEIVKVVHDDGHKQVEDKEGAEDEETDEVNVGEVRAATSWGSGVIGLKLK